MFKRLILFICTFALISLLLPVFSYEPPGYIVDLSTEDGFNDFVDNVNKDMYPIGISTGTNYTTHGMYIEYTDNEGKGLGEYRWTVDYTYNPSDKSITFVGKEDELNSKQKDDLRLSIYTDFSSVDLPYVVVCYRITDGAPISSNNIYLRDSRKNVEYSAAEKTWTPNELIANGEWNYRILDLTNELAGISSRCMGIRLPICKNEGDKFDIKYIASFSTLEGAQSFDVEAFEAFQDTVTPRPTEEITTTTPDNYASSSPNPLTSVLFAAIAVAVIVAVFLLYKILAKKL